MTTIIKTTNHGNIEMPTDASGDIILEGLAALDELVAKTEATYTISYSSHRRGTLILPNGITKDWKFAPRP